MKSLKKKADSNLYRFANKHLLCSIDIKKNIPFVNEEVNIDTKYDQNYQFVIQESIHNLQSDNEITRAAALVELIKFLCGCPSEFSKYLPNDAIDCICNIFTFKTQEDTLYAINFLGFLTCYYDLYSSLILTDFFLGLMNDVFLGVMNGVFMKINPESLFSNCCTLLANLFYDVPDWKQFHESNLLNILKNIPKGFLCNEYLRLITIICSIPNIPSSDSSPLLGILIDCIANDCLLYIKATALKNLKKLLKTEQFDTLQYRLPEKLNILLDILTHCNDYKVVLNDLKLIRKLFCTNTVFVDLLFNIDIYTILRKILEYDNPEIKYQVLKTVNAYIKKDEAFNQEEALKFISYDFKSDLLDVQYKSKIQIINLEGLLFHHLPIDSFIQTLDEDFFESIFELLDSDDKPAKIICYGFLIDLLNLLTLNPKYFSEIKAMLENIGLIPITEKDFLNSDDEIKNMAHIFLLAFNENNQNIDQ